MSIGRRWAARSRLAFSRWRRINLALLGLFFRVLPSEQQRVYALTILIGAFCGIAAVAFHLTIRFAEHHLIDRATHGPGHSWIWWTILTPVLGALLCGALLQFVVPEARGSGIPQVKVAYAVRGGKISFTQSTLGKFVLGVLQIGSGASLGREGPTVQICAGVASLMGRAAALSRNNLRRMLPVGAAAGIAAAFNAPIAAVTFTIEEIVGDLDQTVLSGVIIAAALAAAIERTILGEHPVFEVPAGYGLHYPSSLLFYALLGIAAAAVSLLFTESLLKLRGRFRQLGMLPRWIQPAIGGMVVGVLIVIAWGWLHTYGINGGGYDTLAAALSGRIALRVMLALCALKIVATLFSYASGGAGGLFAPSLFIGGMLGGSVGVVDTAVLHHPASEIGAFALVGMGATFAGIIRAPITSILIIFEMTGSYGLILPLMIANMTAYALARHWRPVPIYEALLEQDGIVLPHPRGAIKHAVEQLLVADAMTANTIAINESSSAHDALKRISQFDHSVYPVTASDDRFRGTVSEARLRRTIAEGGGKKLVSELITDRHFTYPDQPLVTIMMHMNRSKTRQVAVVERGDGRRLAGIISMSDVIRAQAHAVTNAAGDATAVSLPNVEVIPEKMGESRG